jgi:hypothetical protein
MRGLQAASGMQPGRPHRTRRLRTASPQPPPARAPLPLLHLSLPPTDAPRLGTRQNPPRSSATALTAPAPRLRLPTSRSSCGPAAPPSAAPSPPPAAGRSPSATSAHRATTRPPTGRRRCGRLWRARSARPRLAAAAASSAQSVSRAPRRCWRWPRPSGRASARRSRAAAHPSRRPRREAAARGARRRCSRRRWPMRWSATTSSGWLGGCGLWHLCAHGICSAGGAANQP